MVEAIDAAQMDKGRYRIPSDTRAIPEIRRMFFVEDQKFPTKPLKERSRSTSPMMGVVATCKDAI